MGEDSRNLNEEFSNTELETGASPFAHGRSMFDVRCSMFDVRIVLWGYLMEELFTVQVLFPEVISTPYWQEPMVPLLRW